MDKNYISDLEYYARFEPELMSLSKDNYIPEFSLQLIFYLYNNLLKLGSSHSIIPYTKLQSLKT
jgi:hypothetical protein